MYIQQVFWHKKRREINSRLLKGAPHSGHTAALFEIKEKYGFEANAIVTMEEVVEYLYNQPYQGQIYIDDECKARIDTYYEQYGAK